MPDDSVFNGGMQSQGGPNGHPISSQVPPAARHEAEQLRSPAGFDKRNSGVAPRGARKLSLPKAPQPRSAANPAGSVGSRETAFSRGASQISGLVPRGVKRRVPEVGMGLLLVVLGAVLMIVFVGGSDPTRKVLALSRNVSKGDFLSAADITDVALPADTQIAALDLRNQSSIIGSQVAGDYAAGMILTPQLLMPNRDLPEGMIVIGSQLEAGQYPIRNFRAGESVNLLARLPSGDVVTIAEAVQIYEVSQLGSGTTLFISFLVDKALQLEVASVLGDDSLRLGLLGG